jgi:TPR repeat protein
LIDLTNLFRSGKSIFVSHLTEYLLQDDEYQGLLDRWNEVLLLGDRLVCACYKHPSFREVEDFFELLYRIYQPEQQNRANIERLLAKVEIWLKTIYSFSNSTRPNLYGISSMSEYSSLTILYDKLQLLAEVDLLYEVKQLASLKSVDDMKTLLMIAREMRNHQTHYPGKAPSHWEEHLLKATLALIIAPLFKQFRALQTNLADLITHDWFEEEDIYLMQQTRRIRQEHLRWFQGRDPLVEKVQQIVNHSDTEEGSYLLFNAPVGVGKTAFCCKLTEIWSSLQSWGDRADRVQTFTPWLPGCLFVIATEVNTPQQVIEAIILQGNKLLLEPVLDVGKTDAIEELVNRLVKECGQARIIIDGLDKLKWDEHTRSLLPKALPKGAHIILTSRPNSDLIDWITRERKVQTFTLSSLTKEEMVQIIGLDERDKGIAVFYENLFADSMGWPKQIVKVKRELKKRDWTEIKRSHLIDLFEEQLMSWQFQNDRVLSKELLLLMIVCYPIRITLTQCALFLGKDEEEIKEVLQLVKEQLSDDYLYQPFQLNLPAFVRFLQTNYFSSLDKFFKIKQIIVWMAQLETSQYKEPEFIDFISTLVGKWLKECLIVPNRKLKRIIDDFLTVLEERQQFALLYRIAGASGKHREGKIDERVLRSLERAAEAGYPPAMNWLGFCYLNGVHLPKNSEMGIRWIKEAAKAGYEQAMNNLGQRLLYGEGIEKDPEEGKKWIQKAVDKGFVRAMNNLGVYLISQNKEEAEYWLRRAAEAGYPRAMFRLALFLLRCKKKDEGKEWLEKAATHGDIHAQRTLGQFLIEGHYFDKDPDRGIEWVTLAAESGNTDAILYLVKKYFEGKDIQTDRVKGEEWLQRGAASGNEMLMFQLGKYLIEGKYLVKNLEEGLIWLERAAASNDHSRQELIRLYLDGDEETRNPKRGEELLQRWIDTKHKQALYEAGKRYLRGIGVEKNIEKAEKWLIQAAEAGSQQAMLDLGNGYLDGDILPHKQTEGVTWLERAAANQDAHAMYILGKRYLFGLGLSRNYDKGFTWIKKAADLGDPQAIQVLEMGLINRLR